MSSAEFGPVAPERITVIGGGTGNFTVLSALKPYVNEGLTAIVNMADDGGSTGKLRDEYGVLPPGDLRQCLVALSNSPEEIRDLFNFRFPEGANKPHGLNGHSIGNLVIAAAEQIKDGDIGEAVKMASHVFNITGQVLPVTRDNRRLVITTTDGQTINGEHAAEMTDVPSLMGAGVGFDKEQTDINDEAEAAIKASDMVVIAPGDLYTSIAPTLAVRGMREALRTVPVLQIINLMNRSRHTKGFTAADFASETERLAGGPVLDVVLYNNKRPNQAALRRYEAEGEFLVEGNKKMFKAAAYRAIGKSLISNTVAEADSKDALATNRSLIRHDPRATARAVMAIYYTNGFRSKK